MLLLCTTCSQPISARAVHTALHSNLRKNVLLCSTAVPHGLFNSHPYYWLALPEMGVAAKVPNMCAVMYESSLWVHCNINLVVYHFPIEVQLLLGSACHTRHSSTQGTRRQKFGV